MKITFYSMMLLVLIATGCTKDPYKGVKSNERSIEAVTLGNGLVQVGPAVVDRLEGKVSVTVLMQPGTDLTKVTAQIQTSYLSSINPANGTTINFADSANKHTFIVTSEMGQSRKWTMEIIPFTETIIGDYKIDQLVLYGGTGPEYGGGALMPLESKPWVWPATGGPVAELDNTLKFEFTGVTPEGKTFGKVTNNAGADGLYADFMYQLPVTDVNSIYRKIPKGESRWERDYSANLVTFIATNGTKTQATFIGVQTIDLGNGNKKEVKNSSFDFKLKGSDDWGNIYSDLDKFVKNPRRFWVDVKKQ